MEEKSGTSKKIPVKTDACVVPLSSASVSTADTKAKRRVNATGSTKKNQKKGSRKNEQMRVIEGGACERGPDMKDYIGHQLKAIYDDILKQPVPARFTDLLHDLASKSRVEE